MHRLSDPAIEAILNEWDIAEYDPPNTDIREWNRAVETLCDTYGIPDAQRPQCAARFARGELRTELEKMLKDAREKFGPISWVRFTTFMVAFDREETSLLLPGISNQALQVTFESHGRVGIALLSPLSSALMRNPLNRAPILQETSEAHWGHTRSHWLRYIGPNRCRWFSRWLHFIGPSCCRWCSHCCGIRLRGHCRR